MSFTIDIGAPDLTEVLAQRVAELSIARRTYPLGWTRSQQRSRPTSGRGAELSTASLTLPQRLTDGHELFSAPAPGDTPFLGVNPLLAPQLAELFVMLGNELPSGFWFRAGWGDESSARELLLSAYELAALARNARVEADLWYVAGGVSRETVAPKAPGQEEHTLPPCHFANPGPLRDRLVAAVVAGAKTTTSSLLAEYHDESLPCPGDRFRVVDSQERDVCVIEVKAVEVRRLSDVDDEFARDEGEGFHGAAQWRAAHESFWASDDEVRGLGIVLSDDTLVVGERFRVVRDGSRKNSEADLPTA